MNTRLFAVAITLFSVGACSSSRLPTDPVVYSQAEAADSIRVRVGQTVIVEGLRIRFDAVENDSRCPIDAVCVWAGDAVAIFTVEQNSASTELKLHTYLEPKSGTAHGFKVELLVLSPARRASVPTRQSDYSAWIRITPAG